MDKLSAEVQKLAAQWLKWDPNPDTKKEIQDLVDKSDEAELKKRLVNRISFGTAGLREAMKAGFAYMNDLTVIQASQGFATYLEKTVPGSKDQGVVIGYDGRYNSQRYAQNSANIFLSKGFKVFLFNRMVATPHVSFGVVDRHAAAGIMVTASHNPKNDNGYKVYWSNSCQIVEPHDKGISECIMANLEPWQVESDLFKKSPLCHDDTEEVLKHYFEKIQEWCFHREDNKASKMPIVYTPMHGVGLEYATRAFEAYGLPAFVPVKEQMHPDPDFPTVPFPNPEEGKGALKLSMAAADSSGAKVIIANDPDADRLAAAEKQPSGEWKIFNGNELGIILADWAYTQYKTKHPNVDNSSLVVLNTTVSSKMLWAMAKAEGLHYEETLTGFKWLGNKAQDLAKTGKKFLFAFEEAIGYMIGDMSLDKDGIRAAAAFAEMSVHYYMHDNTLANRLKQLQEKYGYFASNNRYFFNYDPSKLAPIFDYMRNGGKYFEAAGRFKIKHIRDLTTPGYDTQQADKKPILPVSRGSQMITFFFENGAILTLRGSGTEPKIKYYSELQGTDVDATNKELAELVQAVIHDFLRPEANGLVKPSDN
jgi:phosphomannomutase